MRLIELLPVNIFKLFFFIFFYFNTPIGLSYPSGLVQTELIPDSLLAKDLHKKGVELGMKGEYEESIRQFKRIYQIYSRLYGVDNYRLASPLINMGIQFRKLGMFDEALLSYKQAEKLYINAFGEDYHKLGIVYTNMGNIFSEKGDYLKSIDYSNQAINILKKDSLKSNNILQTIRSNIIDTKLILGQNKEVINLSLRNLKTTLPDLKPKYYDLMAHAYQNLKDNVSAEKYYILSIENWIKLFGNDHIEVADEYLFYASFLISVKQFEKAIFYNSKAQAIVRKHIGEKSTNYALVLTNFGDYYYNRENKLLKNNSYLTQRKENLQRALDYYQQAIVSVVDLFYEKDPFIDPALENILSDLQLVEIFKKKAKVLDNLGDLFLLDSDQRQAMKYFSAAVSSLSKATELIHRIRIGFENEGSKLFMAQNQESIFSDAIGISYKLFQYTKNQKYIHLAFWFSEQSKSSSLLAAVKNLKAKEFGGIPDSLLSKEQYLKVNLANYNSMLLEEKHLSLPDSQKVNLYASKIFKLGQEHEELIKHFEELYPSYYKLKYENKIVDIKSVQEKMRTRDVLIEFAVNEPSLEKPSGEIFRFIISKDHVDFSRETIDSTYNQQISVLYNFLTNSNYLATKRKDYIDYSTSAYNIYKKLLYPVAHYLKGKDVTIVPDDKLSYIPFDALLTELPDTSKMNFNNLKYLIHLYPINYSYSATLLYDFSEVINNEAKNILAFSPDYHEEIGRKANDNSNVYHFIPLVNTEDEIEKISNHLKTVHYTGFNASKANFLSQASNFDILHLAMHTIINDSLPMFSKLVFSDPKIGSDDDGFLNTYEIYNMKLNSRMVVLSACETGSGKLQKGEGVMSMARGFLYAGCPSIIMTMWQVDDQSGSNLMADFYNYLSKGKRKDVALRLAKLKHLENADPAQSHPHYWLGYVSVGSSDPLFSGKKIYLIVFLILIVIGLIGDWYLRKRFKSNIVK